MDNYFMFLTRVSQNCEDFFARFVCLAFLVYIRSKHVQFYVHVCYMKGIVA
jgi:hypothetical protein